MAAEDLNVPLGQHLPVKRRRQWQAAIPLAVAGALGLVVATFAGWALLVDDPLGGEPYVVVATAGAPQATVPKVVAGIASSGGQNGAAPAPAAAPPQVGPPAGTRTITIIDGSTGQRQQVNIPAPQDGAAKVDPNLLETSRHGAIPRIGPDGKRPVDVYAQAVNRGDAKPDVPRIALVISGLGVGANVTREAFAKLPAPVTFAFSPYGSEADQQAMRARAEGHEVLLQVPMEPFEYPDNDPGPQTLLSSVSADQNLDRLHWLMSRLQGYVGVVNRMGARFTASEPALAPVMREVAKRGLLYLDDASSGRSLAAQIAASIHLPFVKAEIVLDSVPTPAGIDRALSRLEAAARERGSAVGIASATPAAVDRIALWAKAAQARGLVLVPISALAARPNSS